VPAELWRAFLFGSKARREARPDSDVDVLLVFRRLPPGREPQAAMAEAIADGVAEETGIPVTVWSVSLPDLEPGARTPMLVDALEDGIPLWPADAPPVLLPYTPPDALFCTGALLDRVGEGSAEVEDALDAGDLPAAAKRARDDLVRMCTAALLLEGITRPRRGESVRAFAEAIGVPPGAGPIFRWAASSYGPDGKDGDGPVPPPPGGIAAVAWAMEVVRRAVAERRAALASVLAGGR
jgi:hypothetical protein